MAFVVVHNCKSLQTLNELLKGNILSIARDLLEDVYHLDLGYQLFDTPLDLHRGELEVSQKHEEPVQRHMHLLILQTLEGHVLAHPKYVRAVVRKDLPKVYNPLERDFGSRLQL